MKIAVTGANGYIGQFFLKLASGSEKEIVAFSRVRPDKYCTDWFFYDLTVDTPPVLPSDIDVLLHLATCKNPDNLQDSSQELFAADLLIAASEKAGAKFIFVSSQTARSDAPTAYGRTKWCIEQKVLSAGGWVVRPGQVYGGELRGLFGTLVDTVKRLPILPAFIPAPKIQPIHVVELSMGLLHIAERSDVPSGVYCLAAPESVSFSKFLDEIAKSRLRCWRMFIPVPVICMKVLALILGKSLRSRLGLERLNSLFDLPAMTTTAALKQLDLTLRPLHSGMQPSGKNRRRCLLQEGQALFTYILKQPAGTMLLRRYVRTIEKLRSGRILGLPRQFIRWSALLALIDGGSSTKTTWGKEFMWRLDSATILAEATPLGARRFLGIGYRHSFVRSFFTIAHGVVSEASWQILGLLLAPVTRNLLPHAFEEQS
jgi:dTDP-4-dehydrorhamnose reductase